MEVVAQVVINSIGLSGLYLMVALGLTLAFGIMKIFNFAHGELYMLGAYGVWILYAVGQWPFLAAIAVSMATVGVLGIIIERFFYRPLRREPVTVFIAAAGIMFILQVLSGQVWGLGLNKPVPYAYREIFHPFGAALSMHKLILIIASVALLLGLAGFLNRTKQGQAIRACAQDPEAASLMGISIDRSCAITMGLAGILAGAAGAFVAPISVVNPYMGGQVLLKGFFVVIVGGAGSISGSVLAAFLFGFMDSVITTVVDSTIANLAGLLIMFVILTFRPRGLLGREMV